MEAEAQEMGGHLSHEYHYMNQIGDEKLITCSSCSHSIKDTGTDEPKCAECGGTSFEKHRGIEVRLPFAIHQMIWFLKMEQFSAFQLGWAHILFG